MKVFHGEEGKKGIRTALQMQRTVLCLIPGAAESMRSTLMMRRASVDWYTRRGVLYLACCSLALQLLLARCAFAVLAVETVSGGGSRTRCRSAAGAAAGEAHTPSSQHVALHVMMHLHEPGGW